MKRAPQCGKGLPTGPLGFTLVELLISVAIAAIVMVACYSMFSGFWTKSEGNETRGKALMQLELVMSSLQKYYRESSSAYAPVGISAFTTAYNSPAFPTLSPASPITPLTAGCHGFGFYEQYAAGGNPLFRQYYTDCVNMNTAPNYATITPVHIAPAVQNPPPGGINCTSNRQFPVLIMNEWDAYPAPPTAPPAVPLPNNPTPAPTHHYQYPQYPLPEFSGMALCFKWVQNSANQYTDIIVEGSVLYQAGNGNWQVARRTVNLPGPNYLSVFRNASLAPLIQLPD